MLRNLDEILKTLRDEKKVEDQDIRLSERKKREDEKRRLEESRLREKI